uniref:Uncharacterized protein n=1 Tax=Siphoviridae sp. ct9GL2 TaxID=2825368 RepID=A0A8S5PVD8_9CAUD|nr:MAG TPA: hypothetical protein [Siphoviridae sp. ct9GL2]
MLAPFPRLRTITHHPRVKQYHEKNLHTSRSIPQLHAVFIYFQ